MGDVGSFETPVPPGSEDRQQWYRMQHNHIWYRVLACCRPCATRHLHAMVYGYGTNTEIIREGRIGQAGI